MVSSGLPSFSALQRRLRWRAFILSTVNFWTLSSISWICCTSTFLALSRTLSFAHSHSLPTNFFCWFLCVFRRPHIVPSFGIDLMYIRTRPLIHWLPTKCIVFAGMALWYLNYFVILFLGSLWLCAVWIRLYVRIVIECISMAIQLDGRLPVTKHHTSQSTMHMFKWTNTKCPTNSKITVIVMTSGGGRAIEYR